MLNADITTQPSRGTRVDAPREGDGTQKNLEVLEAFTRGASGQAAQGTHPLLLAGRDPARGGWSAWC